MADGILAEFFVKLGWKVDDAGAARVTKILLNTEVQAKLAADAIEKIVGKLKQFSEGIATAYEDLYYAAQRNRTSVEGIKAFGYAVGNMGSSVEAARSSIERFGLNLRSNSGFYGVLQGMGVRTKAANGQFRDTVSIMTDLGKVLASKPEQLRLQYADMLGIDEQTMRAIISPDFGAAMDKYKKLIEAGHFDPEGAALAWKDFNNTFRDFMTTLDLLVDKVMTRLMKEFGPSFREFVDYLIKNSDAVTSSILKVIDGVIDFAKAGVKWIGEDSDFKKSWAIMKTDIMKVGEAIVFVVRATEKLVEFLHRLNQYANDAAKALNWLTGQKGPNGETYYFAPQSGGSASPDGGSQPVGEGSPSSPAGVEKPATGTGEEKTAPPVPSSPAPSVSASPASPSPPTSSPAQDEPKKPSWWGSITSIPWKADANKPAPAPKDQPAATPQVSSKDSSDPDSSIAGDLSASSTYARKNEQLPDVQGFIVHHTGGRGTPQSVINTLNARGLGVQFVMDRDGKIYRALPKGARAAHILPSEINNLSNSNTVGMEVIAKDDSDLTPAEIASGVAFLKKMKAKYPNLQVFGHGEVNPHHKMASEGKTITDAFRASGDVPQITHTPLNAQVPLDKRTIFNFAHGSVDTDTPGIHADPGGLKTAPLTTPSPGGSTNVTLNQKTSIAVDGSYDAHELAKATALSQLKTNGDLLRTMQGAAM